MDLIVLTRSCGPIELILQWFCSRVFRVFDDRYGHRRACDCVHDTIAAARHHTRIVSLRNLLSGTEHV